VPDDVVTYKLEEANKHVSEASEESSRMVKRLAVERQEKRDIIREARKEREPI
jgi:hypothetical protein